MPRLRTVLPALVLVAAFLARAETGEDEGALAVSGRVVDESLRPVPNAVVEARWDGGRAQGSADADGRFEIGIPLRTEGARLVHVEAREATRIGWTAVEPRTTRLPERLETRIVLREAVEDALSFVAEGGDAGGVGVRLFAGTPYSHHEIADLRADEAGRLALRLAPGDYGLRVTDPRWAEASVGFRLPFGPTSTYDPRRVHLERARSVAVRVLDDGTGSPIVGATVSVPLTGWGRSYAGAPEERTGADGVAAFARVPADRAVRLGVWAPGFSSSAAQARPGVAVLDVRLSRAERHALRWALEAGPWAPPEGSAVIVRTVSREGGRDFEARVLDGHVVLDDAPSKDLVGYAVVREEAAAALGYDLVDGARRVLAARFVPARKIRVRLRDADDRPVVDQPLRLEERFLLRDSAARLASEWSLLRTDERGEVLLDGVFREPVRLRLLPGAGWPVEQPLGVVDGMGGPDDVTFRLPRRQTVELHVTLDGRPGLRSDLSIYCAGEVTGFDADPVAGVVRFPVAIQDRPTGTSLSVRAAGYDVWSRSIGPSPGAVVRFDVPLRSVVDLVVVLEPKPEGWFDGDELQLQRWEDERWTLAGDFGAEHLGNFMVLRELRERGFEGWRAIRGVVGGRYRLVHVPSGLSGEPFDIEASRGVHRVRFDPTAVRAVSGRLLGPPETDWSLALLESDHAEGLGWGVDEAGDPVRYRARGDVRPDGSFDVVVPRVPAVSRLWVRHPLLRTEEAMLPAEGSGPIEIRVRPRVVLSMRLAASDDEEEGAPVRPGRSWLLEAPSLHEMERETREGAVYGPPTVWARRDGAWKRIERLYDEGTRTFRVGLEDAGPVSLVLDMPGSIPLLLPETVVPEGGRTMGPLKLARGSRICVFARGPVTSLRASAEPLDGADLPLLVRSDRVEGTDPALLLGLPAGRYRVLAYAHRAFDAWDAVPARLDREVVVDGESDVDLVVDTGP